MEELIIEKDNDIYDIFYHTPDTEHFCDIPLYKGTDERKAKETINHYYDPNYNSYKVEIIEKCTYKIVKVCISVRNVK